MASPSRVLAGDRMDRLTGLLDQAKGRQLSDAELSEVTDAAVRRCLVEFAVWRLLMGGQSSLMNLRRAHSLRLAYADYMRRRRMSSVQDASPEPERVSFTHHAVERYTERYAAGASPEEAEEQLRREAGLAVRVRQKAKGGRERWLTPGGAVLIIRRNGPGRSPTCITVLPP